FFGKADETVPDPYFDGKGPERTGCNFCGGCMTGCRYNAKNTLDKNYLHLAGSGDFLTLDFSIPSSPRDPNRDFRAHYQEFLNLARMFEEG
ncbi:MAG: hypothetical protein MUO54_02470, partial [Anaerolineales bacterium]|nr:hypothetical protein [Anaerolineales bacterium]